MKTSRREALALLGSTLLAACGAAETVTQDETDPFEGGIGGTGIVGTLYGYGSLLINGLTVELAANTIVTTPFGPGSQMDLAPGQVLTVAARKGRDGIVATEVSIDYTLVGPLKVSGASASVNNVPLMAWQGALGQGRANQRVAVSGTWTPAGVRASRIDLAPNSMDLIAGTFDDNGIGGVALGARVSRPARGSYTVALGRAANGGFDVEQFKSGRFAAVRDLKLLSVDGYLEPIREAPGFRIAGLGHSFAADAKLAQVGQKRVIYFGPYNGRFDARLGFLVPDDFSQRDTFLRDGLSAAGSSPLLRL